MKIAKKIDVKKIGYWKNTCYSLKHIFTLTVMLTLSFTILVLVAISLLASMQGALLPDPVTLMDAVSLMSLIFVAGLWLSRIKLVWRESLPNYLYVNAYYKDNIVINIEYAKLTDPADIRSHTQSLLQALNANTWLNLSPVLSDIKAEVIHIDSSGQINKGQPFELFEVSIELLEPLNKQAISQHHDLPKDFTLHWTYPLNQENKFVTIPSIKGELEQTKPLSSFPKITKK